MKQILPLVLSAGLLVGGCNQKDPRLARMAQQTTAQQATQNQHSAQLNEKVVENHRAMIQAVEQSRQDLQRLHHEINAQQQAIDQQRQQLATRQYRESLLVPVLSSLGIVLAAALPLILAWYLLHGLRSTNPEAELVGQLLVEDLVRDQPILLPPSQPVGAIHVPTPATQLAEPVDSPPF